MVILYTEFQKLVISTINVKVIFVPRYACFGCMLSEKVDRGKCYVDHICVHEDARGKGVGKLLMERAEYEGRARNCRVRHYFYLLTDFTIF